ncbi:MAG TPA: HepT-like ribonuclease domain-containing protein [Pyrinomonadaceae bacterium]|jgi:uncharacterized protein with HEPN domain|nr:HepT-like ribonuclease domain-containing protein [Pyrinomonadaceae bacterium]
MKDDSVYLRHIDECLRRIEKNISLGLDAFLASETIQDATLRNLQTMSEATQRLSDELKSTRPDIEWERISAFRNILVHNYLGIDLELIWTIIERDTPALKNAVSEMIRDLPKATV